MKKVVFIFLVWTICCTSSQSQHYIVPGVGYSLAFFNSDDLELFKDRYNSINRPRGLISQFRGLKFPVGVRFELGYFHFSKLTSFAYVGFQNYVTNDAAEFDNFEKRELTLKMKSFFVEGGVGPRLQQFFICGLLTVYFQREITLESFLKRRGVPKGESLLNGEYTGPNSISTDIGVAFGVNKDIVMLTLRITYPLFTSGSDEMLTDDNTAKVKEGSSVFPDEYDNALLEKPYKGISSNIDGLKILITLNVPLKFKK